MLGQVKQILEEYREHLPLTVRQIYYRMVGAYRHPKGQAFAESLGDLLTNARRAGRSRSSTSAMTGSWAAATGRPT